MVHKVDLRGWNFTRKTLKAAFAAGELMLPNGTPFIEGENRFKVILGGGRKVFLTGKMVKGFQCDPWNPSDDSECVFWIKLIQK